MKRKLTAGKTSVSLPIFIQDTSSTTGGGLSGLTSGTSGLVAEYRRRGQSTWTTITLTSKTLGTWTSGGFVADGALGGAYEVDLPNAVCASGERWVAIRLRGAANMLPCLIEIELDVVDYTVAAFGANTVAPANSTIALIYALLQLTDADVASIVTLLGTPAGVSLAADIAAAKASADLALRPAVPGRAIAVSATTGKVTSEAVELDSVTAAKIAKIEAVVSGTVTGAGTSTEVFVGPSATVTVTVDASGNRSQVVVS